MIPLQSKPKIPPVSSKLNMRRRKRFSGGMFIGAGVTLAILILAGAVFAVQRSGASHAAPVSESYYHNNPATTINGLKKISQIGSTANITDANGNRITVDPNPYKIAIAPPGLSNGLRAGDIVVSNIGNNDHGVTLVKFPGQKGPGHLFNKANDGVLGPASLAFDNGKLLVANSTGNNVLVLNPDGTLFATIKNNLFNGPWGIAVGSQTFYSHRNGMFSFFAANKFDAKILRIDVFPQGNGLPRFRVVQVGQFTKNGNLTKIDLQWWPSLQLGNRTWKDVLLAIDPAHNRIAAFANSSSIQGSGNGVTVFQGSPLNNPGGMAVNPINGDLLVVNLNNNNLVELNPTRGKVVGIKQIDPAAVDNQGNGSALFGVAATRDQWGNLRVFFTDDNTNTLDVLGTW